MGGPGSGRTVKRAFKMPVKQKAKDRINDRSFRLPEKMKRQMLMIKQAKNLQYAAMYRYACQLLINQYLAGKLDCNAINALSEQRGRPKKKDALSTILDHEAQGEYPGHCPAACHHIIK